MNRLAVTIQLVCRELPGIRFCDLFRGQPGVREPVYLGIQRGKDVVDAVPATTPRNQSCSLFGEMEEFSACSSVGMVLSFITGMRSKTSRSMQINAKSFPQVRRCSARGCGS